MSTKLEKIGNHIHTLASNYRVSLPSRRRITLGVFSIADVRWFVPDCISRLIRIYQLFLQSVYPSLANNQHS